MSGWDVLAVAIERVSALLLGVPPPPPPSNTGLSTRRWSETAIAKAVPVVDGVCRTQWRVRRDLPLSDTYVLSARSVPAGLAEAQVRHPRNGALSLCRWTPAAPVFAGASPSEVLTTLSHPRS